MKALVYRGSREVRVEEVSDPKIEKQTDVLVKITSTNICGSDLHMYEGRTDVEEGKVLGHENLGEVVEVDKAIQRVKAGDMSVQRENVQSLVVRSHSQGPRQTLLDCFARAWPG